MSVTGINDQGHRQMSWPNSENDIASHYCNPQYQHTQIFSCRKINSNCVHITQREYSDDFCSKFDVRKYDFTFLKFCSRNLSRSCCTIFFCSSILGAVHAICLILLNVKAFSCDPILKKKSCLALEILNTVQYSLYFWTNFMMHQKGLLLGI